MRKRSLVVGLLAAAATAVSGAAATGALADPADNSDEVQPYIVGGHDATEEYSFVVSLQQQGQHFCGGSLIASDWVLTAAHCVDGASPSQVQLRIGSLDRTSGGEEAQAAEITVHPDYNGTNDIALIKLESPVEATPIQLGSSADVGTESRILGWGQTTPQPGGDSGPDTLQELDVAVVDPSGCAGGQIDADTELCTDNPGGDSGACYGDSGGPQIAKEGGNWVLIGATSRSGGSSTCAIEPSIYTSTVAHADWVNEVTGGAVS
ncbi:S1 family peptidase [Thermocrispum municipale]|jgi:secreted trypsin-like serine protease|uniref:S1 family peptidase n=1 Tax=Thermocrispum municipale TaxID=37926 RepID=UPI0004102B70|nr:serine protease [Thermocrispum municipale]